MTYLAILRGINVGGKRKLLMNDLKELFREMQLNNPVTYIQSGNVIFNTSEKLTGQRLSKDLETAIKQRFGYEVPVIIREVAEIGKIVESNPFLKQDFEIERLHLCFLSEVPKPEQLEKLKSHNCYPDDFQIQGKDVFIFCSGKYSDSKLSNNFFESKLKVKATTRNWKTILKLSELAKKG